MNKQQIDRFKGLNKAVNEQVDKIKINKVKRFCYQDGIVTGRHLERQRILKIIDNYFDKCKTNHSWVNIMRNQLKQRI